MKKHTQSTLISSTLLALTIFNSTPILNANIETEFPETKKAVIADLEILKAAGIPVMYKDNELNVGYAQVSSFEQGLISHYAHEKGRCGNYEALDDKNASLSAIQSQILSLRAIQSRNIVPSVILPITLVEKPEVTLALNELNSANIRNTVEFLSSFQNRYNKDAEPNKHIQPFMDRLAEIAKNANYPITIDTISHRSTNQKSIRVRIEGSTRPDEIIVLGGHLDSISGWGGSGAKAPGADDNASGSASLTEAFRVITMQPQPQRTLEFYWYAGEESGLLGSAEIADTAKQQNKDIVAVLQLDMTLFPGDGVFKIASMTDFTSVWLRDYLMAANQTYLKATIQEDKCGYGCSDHASWFRRGYPTLFPTESKFKTSFKDIHTPRDVISPVLNFDHALLFSKIAAVMALELGNSTLRQPNL